MRHRHRQTTPEDILHDFDPETRTLRIAFVSPEGRIVGVTYKLCSLCGVTMEEQAPGGGFKYRCTSTSSDFLSPRG